MKTVSYILVIATILLQPIGAIAAIDDAKAAASGIRKLAGKHLTLYTDLSDSQIDDLPTVFDRAFPQWCSYFQRQEGDLADWRMTGFLIQEKDPFRKTGLLPDDLPPFDHGFSRDGVLWLYEQPSDYYRRHLLLHEGTHGFMNTVLGGCGPPWYMEAVAEYLATHRWHDGRLTLGYMPRSPDEVPQWGRIRILQNAVAQRRALRFNQVVDSAAFTPENPNEPYAWCWAAGTLLDRHPRYRERFHQIQGFVRQPDFNARFHHLFETDWQALCEEWQLLVANLEYGYDVERCAVDFSPGKKSPLAGVHSSAEGVSQGPTATGSAASIIIRADRGWQNTGLQLETGTEYRLAALGRYQVATSARPPTSPQPVPGGDKGVRAVWWCEPNGVSIRYYRRRPLGVLLAAVRPDRPLPDRTSALLFPTVVGLGVTLVPAETGTLFLKINDSPGELADNVGELKVEVRRQ